jgi:N-methylhydantoinase B
VIQSHHGSSIALDCDRFRRAPDGMAGGGPGSTGYCDIRRGGQSIRLRSKDETRLQRGDIVTLALGGGGGYGARPARPARSLEADVADGLVTPAKAAKWGANSPTDANSRGYVHR